VLGMNFLDKLYESNYFGIGLFAVISFLVVTFLVVLFFGKRDEKKRRMDTLKEVENSNTGNAFSETSTPTPIEVPVANTPVMSEPVGPVMPTAPENIAPAMADLTPVTPVAEVKPVAPIMNESVAPINFSSEPIRPVAPINYESQEFVEVPKEVTPINVPVTPIINENPTPIITEPVGNVEPIRLEPTTYDIPVEPKVIEPIKITIPEEPVRVSSIINEVKPIVNPVINEVTPTIVEPAITDTYYKPIEKVESEEVQVPNIDFDALAKSISDELDELENSSSNYQKEVKVTPIDEVIAKPATQFSSVYVNEPVKPVQNESVDLPKKIDLPSMKSDEIEPENYNL